MYKYNFFQNGESCILSFETQHDVFYPTGTSELLVEAYQKCISSPQRILDFGCGCGFVGLALARLGLCKPPIYASDVSAAAIRLAEKNASNQSVEYIARCGSLFEPWDEEKFDIIIEDVAGISDEIAELSSWYPSGVTCGAGRDGTKWVIKIIEQAKEHLVEDGILLVPILSLSGEERIFEALGSMYSQYELVLKKDWFLPDNIASHSKIIESLCADGSIRCDKRFGKWIWTTSIYKASI